MTKRRANGEGSIRKRSDGRWEGRYTAGIHPETGKAIYKNVLGKSQSEVRAKLKEAVANANKLDFTRTELSLRCRGICPCADALPRTEYRPPQGESYSPSYGLTLMYRPQR